MNAIVSVEHLSKSFGGLRAVHDVTFSVDPGEVLGIIGPNGAGKTTLFNSMAGLFPPTSGTVHYLGQDVTAWSDAQLARAGMVRTFQLMRPFGSMTVLDNVAVAAAARGTKEREAEEQAWEILQQVGLDHYATRTSKDLPTAGLKRLELARAMALHPKVLMLDEVLAGLAPTERQPVIDLLLSIRDRGVTLLFVEHVMQAVMALSDKVLVLNHGEMLAYGTPSEVVNNPEVIEAYLGDEVRNADSD
ncbi:MAG: ABC transporter ATP-binding protein [Candidatus Nanopelagicales bacterium]|jgi:branched-chain amino acid transport system ATP-binding protein